MHVCGINQNNVSVRSVYIYSFLGCNYAKLQFCLTTKDSGFRDWSRDHLKKYSTVSSKSSIGFFLSKILSRFSSIFRAGVTHRRNPHYQRNWLCRYVDLHNIFQWGWCKQYYCHTWALEAEASRGGWIHIGSSGWYRQHVSVSPWSLCVTLNMIEWNIEI